MSKNRRFLVVFFEAWGSKDRSFPKRPDLENQAKTMEGWSKIDFRMGRFWAKGRRRISKIRHQWRWRKLAKKSKNRARIDGKMEVHQKSASETHFGQFLVDSGSILGSKMGEKSKKTGVDF